MRPDYERHLRECAICGAEVESYRALVEGMRLALPDRPCRDLVDRVREGVAVLRCQEERGRRRVVWASAVAAVLLAVAGIGGLMPHLRRGVKEGVETEGTVRRRAWQEAARWLCSVQQPDGGWYRPGEGAGEYREALTGLAILAALELKSEPGLDASGRRAAEWLANRVDEEGKIGSLHFPGQPYNQGIGGLALLRWCERHPDSPFREAALRAARRIAAVQTESGGWGYEDQPEEPNVSVTVWQLQALHQALALGGEEWMERALWKGLRWLRSTRNREGRYGYRRADDFPVGSDALTAMSLYCEMEVDAESLARSETRLSLDRVQEGLAASDREPSYYAAYFAIRSLRKAGHREFEKTLGHLESRLLARQETVGRERGSWPASDVYARVGGRVYATAMAAMAVYTP